MDDQPELACRYDRIADVPRHSCGKIKERIFNTMALDVQAVGKDGGIHRTGHGEDWASVQAQLLGKVASVEFGFDPAYLDFE